MISTEKFTFEGSDGSTLDGRLERPRYGRPRAVAIFAHCFTCGKDSRAATFITRALAARDVMVLRFDFVGLGGSPGDLSGFGTQVDDIEAAAKALVAAGHPPTMLIGHSLGGAAVIAAGSRCDTVRAVATIGAPADTDHVLTHLGDKLEQVEDQGEAMVKLAGRDFCIKKSFVEDTKGRKHAEAIERLRKPLLLLHSPTDDIVGIDNAGIIYELAHHPKSFVALDGADHLLTRDRDARYAADVITAWASRYIDSMDEVDQEDRPLKGVVRVTTAGGKFAQHVRTESHDFIADEPESFGGNDDGPTPYDLLLASLGTCTSMTIQMYARKKGISLDKVRIELEHSREHAQDCVDCDKEDAQIQAIDRAIELEGDFTEVERKRMLEIADRCPVHRTLESELHIHTTDMK